MRSVSTDPIAQDGAAPPGTAFHSDGTAEASPPAYPQQIYEETMARLAAITDEWQKARDALRSG